MQIKVRALRSHTFSIFLHMSLHCIFLMYGSHFPTPLRGCMSLTSSCSWSFWACVLAVAPGSPGGSRVCRCHTARADVGPGSSCRCHSCRKTYDIMYKKTIIFSQDFGMQKSRNTEVRHIYQNSGV